MLGGGADTGCGGGGARGMAPAVVAPPIGLLGGDQGGSLGGRDGGWNC